MRCTPPWARWLGATLAAMSVACVPPRIGDRGDDVPRSAGSGERNQPDPQESVCVVQADSLRLVAVTRSPTNNDTLVDGILFKNAYPATYPPYVATAPWYVAGEFVRFGQRVYANNDPPQRISLELLRFVGRYRGVPVFKAADETVTPPPTIYLPIRPGCVFQPFTAVVGHAEPG